LEKKTISLKDKIKIDTDQTKDIEHNFVLEDNCILIELLIIDNNIMLSFQSLSYIKNEWKNFFDLN
jgi:hypothetical protein